MAGERDRASIVVQDLRKIYRVAEREAGLTATLRSLVRRQFREIAAIDGISFQIDPGEIIGFLGPNGAGKTSTLKVLSGLLHPTSGEVSVLGFTPWQRDYRFLRQITLVMGNRSQLTWDIPAADSYQVLKEIYRIPDAQYRATLDELVELLDLGAILHKPVRNLSLGERMKAELAGSLLHGPQILFLDEPTLGLDVTMQARIRRFVAEYNRRTGATVLLTSHYMDDVVALCKRVVVIHRGHLLYDGALAELVERLAPYKLIGITLQQVFDRDALCQYGEVIRQEENRVTLRVAREDAPLRTARLVQDFGANLSDLTVENPPIEEIIDQVFTNAELLTALKPVFPIEPIVVAGEPR